MAKVTFFRCTQAQYDANLENNQISDDALYWTMDTYRTYLGRELTSRVPTYILNWYEDPTSEQKQANQDILCKVWDLDEGQYNLFLNISSGTLVPAVKTQRTTTNYSTFYVYFDSHGLNSVYAQYVVSVHYMTAPSLRNYIQNKFTYPSNTFDPTSNAAPSSYAVAQYVTSKFSALDTGWIPLAIATGDSRVQPVPTAGYLNQQVPVSTGFAYRVVNGNHVYIAGGFKLQGYQMSGSTWPQLTLSAALPEELTPVQPDVTDGSITGWQGNRAICERYW